MRLSSTFCKILKILLHTVQTDAPVKVFGILPQKRERNMLWKLLFALYECNSIYKYGRVELNLFLSEKEYKVCLRDFTGSKEKVVLQRAQKHLYYIVNVFASQFLFLQDF